MQAIFETVFAIAYLSTVIILGIIMLRRSEKYSVTWLYGLMAVTLGGGDSFHMIPRCYALLTGDLASHAAALGIGKLITSVTMTLFYVFLYFIWRKRYQVQGKKILSAIVILLAAARIALCLFPQNCWLSADAPVSWGIYRNIPFVILGIIIIILFYKSAKANDDKALSKLWLAVVLSFAFYIPVVLFARAYPIVGMLMIPKTCAYVWIVVMGYRLIVNKEQ